jgi:N-acetylmuramoyl-L-alanine amidase
MPTRHNVQQGDCLSSVAAQYGLSWEKIWNFGDNADLKKRRADPNVLYPGDVLVIPDKAVNDVMRATDRLHKFVVNRKPTHAKIRLTIDDQPRANLKFELLVDDVSVQGTTDGDGFLSAEIPASAQRGLLLLGDTEPRETHELTFGTLDPIDTNEGVEQRLRSLGLQTEDDLPGAVRAFQLNNNMEATGTVDDALRNKLKERFGQ